MMHGTALHTGLHHFLLITITTATASSPTLYLTELQDHAHIITAGDQTVVHGLRPGGCWEMDAEGELSVPSPEFPQEAEPHRAQAWENHSLSLCLQLSCAAQAWENHSLSLCLQLSCAAQAWESHSLSLCLQLSCAAQAWESHS
ncbi:hypothetical protein JZ751_019912 [Albula glossodonta]|uniref:Uncharacterized protein n=1 Tax=Albula glossodonta TaxID=121402 RepID=A0A8T2MZZ3_9TELE|nr:hypothetical protein JZ751_019912 [Albula glossodonta]